MEVGFRVEWAGVVILLLQGVWRANESCQSCLHVLLAGFSPWSHSYRGSYRTSSHPKPPWIIGVEDILIWTVLFWQYSHLTHTAVLCKAFSLCSESQTPEWREYKNGAKLVFLLTASCNTSSGLSAFCCWTNDDDLTSTVHLTSNSVNRTSKMVPRLLLSLV